MAGKKITKPAQLLSDEAVAQRITQKEHREDNSIENLCLDLVEFLSSALKDVRTSHATEQAVSPQTGHATEQAKSLDDIIVECVDMSYAKIWEWSNRRDQDNNYDEHALLKHKQMFDIMQCNKAGDTKDNTFLSWCRKVACHRSQSDSTATERTATEHADQQTRSFKALAFDMLTNDLWPEQKRNNKFKIQWDKATGEIRVTNDQRNWITNMLRKHLGSAKVAFFIFNHGLPDLFDAPFRATPPSQELL